MATRQNFPVVGKGETFVLNLNMTDVDGNPIDLTGHTITLSLKDKAGVEIADYPTVIDSAGTVTLKVADETTALWPSGNNKYVLIHDQPNGDRKYIAYGSLTVMEVE